MPVSRKYKSLKKSSKTKKHSKNVKKYKSKTRKNINKLRGGELPIITECKKSNDCFVPDTAEFIKEYMRKYLKEINKTKKIELKFKETEELKSHLYLKLYKNDGRFGKLFTKNDDGKKESIQSISNKANNIITAIHVILADYFTDKKIEGMIETYLRENPSTLIDKEDKEKLKQLIHLNLKLPDYNFFMNDENNDIVQKDINKILSNYFDTQKAYNV
jgi:hypothetical protein